MKKILLICILGLSFIQVQAKQVIQLEVNQNSYDQDGLVIKIPIIEDWDQAISVMKKGNGSFQEIIPSSSFELGSMVVPFILYSSDVEKNGKVNITYDIKLIKPDGSIDFEKKNLIVSNIKPPESGIAMYKESSGTKIGMSDPLGEYTFHIAVHDRIKNVEVNFTLKFKVIKQFIKIQMK